MPDFQLFADSFSAYKDASFSDSDLLNNFRSRWTNTFQNGCNINTNGRNSGHGLTIAFGSSVSKTLKHSSVFTVGFAFRVDAPANGNDTIFNLNNNQTPLALIKHNADGTISVYAGNAATLIGTSDRALLDSRFYWIDFIVTLSGSAPITATIEFRINTHVEVSGTGSTGINASSLISNDTTANVFGLSGTTAVGGGGSCTYSDFYIKNTTGYYGDLKILALVPNGDVVTDWTPSTGTIHYVLINSKPADLTKFISAATVGNKDIFDWEDCPGFSGTIKAINIRFLARKNDEGTKSFKINVGDTGTEALSEEFFVSDASEEYYEMSLENDPATSLPFTQAGFNAKRFGVQVIS